MPVSKKRVTKVKKRVATPPSKAADLAYWKDNLKVIAVLLAVWAFLGLGCGVLFADFLNRWQLAGIPFGFFMAQMGAILGFVVLIGVYAKWMDKIDRRHGLHTGGGR